MARVETARVANRAARAVSFVLAAGALVASGVFAPPARADSTGSAASAATSNPGASHSYARWSDTQLANRVHWLTGDSELTGERMLDAEDRQLQIDNDRSVAQGLLAQWLADTYRNAGTSDPTVAIIGGGGLQGITDRLRAAQIIADYHARLVDEFDAASARLQATAIDRAVLIQQLAADQSELARLATEQQRRAVLVADQQARVQAAHDARAQAHLAAAAKTAALAAAQTGMLAAFATPTAAAAPGAFATTGPPNAALLDAYLASKGSPMAGQGASFVASGARNQVDPRLLVAISGAESSFGQQLCGPFNGWGWACPNNPADFADWPTAIETIARGLRTGYLDEGRTSVALIQQKYAPSAAANDPTGLNLNWVTNVSRFLVELGGNPNLVGPGPIGGVALPYLGSTLLGDI